MSDIVGTSRFFGRPVSFKWKIENYSQFPATVKPTLNVSVDNETFVLTAYPSNGIKLSIGKHKHLNTEFRYVIGVVDNSGNHKFENQGSISEFKRSEDNEEYISECMDLLPFCKNQEIAEFHFFSDANRDFYFSYILEVSADDFEQKQGDLLKDDCLVIYGELKQVHLTSNIEDSVSYYLPEELSTDLGKMFKDKANTDVVLSVGKKQIPAHMAILSARSPVFAAMFQHNMSEKLNKTVSIEEVNPNTMHRLLRFIYMGKIENAAENVASLASGELSQLYAAADRYAVMGLKEMCSKVMQAKLSANNLEEFTELAYKHNDAVFQAAIMKFISDNESLIKTAKWQQLMSKIPQMASEIVKTALQKKKPN